MNVSSLAKGRSGVGVLLLVSILKIVLFVALYAGGRVAPFIGDNAKDHYVPIAKRILEEHRFNGPDSRPDSKVPPGYPLVLAAAMSLSGTQFAVFTVCLQMAFDFGVAVLLLLITRELSTPGVALGAGLAWLVFPPAVVISTWITAETSFTFALVASLALFLCSLRRPGWVWPLITGLSLGLCTMFRGTSLPLPVVLVPFYLFRRRSLHALTFLAGMGLIVFPWYLRNTIVLNDRIPVAVGFGSTFMMGADERYFTGDAKPQGYPALFRRAAQAGVVKPPTDHETAIDGWMFRIGVWLLEERLHNKPLSFPEFVAIKFVRLWYATEIETRTKILVLASCSLLVVPAGFWQLWLWRRKNPLWFQLTGGMLMFFIVLHVVTLPLIRYMLPVYPMLLPGACCCVSRLAFGVIEAVQGMSNRRLRQLAPSDAH